MRSRGLRQLKAEAKVQNKTGKRSQFSNRWLITLPQLSTALTITSKAHAILTGIERVQRDRYRLDEALL